MRSSNLEHDPEKASPGRDPGWLPVFGKDHARFSSVAERHDRHSRPHALRGLLGQVKFCKGRRRYAAAVPVVSPVRLWDTSAKSGRSMPEIVLTQDAVA